MRSQSSLDKEKIARSFSRSAVTYDKHAGLQKSLASELAKTISSLNISPKNILDVGTGTGEMAFLLKDMFRDANITGCDIAPGMIEVAAAKDAAGRIKFEVCDAEILPYRDRLFDLVVSNTTYQWTGNLRAAFEEAFRVLGKGYFVFITFGPDSLNELKKAYKLNVDQKAEYLHEYRTISEISALLEMCGFKISSLTSRLVKTVYPNLREMLKTIKAIGALNASVGLPKGLRSRSKIKKMTEFYEKTFRMDRDIYATYEIIEAVCVKT
jgi:malonyl-CoA O-methyltransferase